MPLVGCAAIVGMVVAGVYGGPRQVLEVAVVTVPVLFLAVVYQTWLTQGDALLLGVAVAVLGPLGDLFESLIKRDAGIKDAGSLFGPHGGALDRADAALFTLVAGYYVWVAVMH